MEKLSLRTGSKSQRKGLKGETIALWYLRFHGYRLLERNYRVGHKEIDLIMRKGETIAFIEVKSGFNTDSKLPLSFSVGYQKQRNIIFASETYVLRKKLMNVVLRYDIVEVDLKTYRVNHIKCAYN